MQKRKLLPLTLLPAALVLAACGNGGEHTPPKDTPALDVAKKLANYNGDYSAVFASSGFGNGGNFDVEWASSEANVKNGQMQLSISKNAEGREYPWKGGEIRTYDFFGYGDFGTKMKPSNTPGTASTFFTYTGEWDSEAKHPSTGSKDTRNPDNEEGIHDEIDIEFLGKDTTKVQFNYFTKGKGGHEYMYDLGFDASKEWHEYGFRWEKERIIWFVDGKAVYQATQDIPSHPGRIFTNYWCGNGGAAGWMGNYDHTKATTADYQWISVTGEGKHTAKEDPGPTPTPTPGAWDDIDPIDIELSPGCDTAYTLNLAADKKSVEVSYTDVAAESYKNIAFILPESAKQGDTLCFTVENLASTLTQIRADVNAATTHGAHNITAINTSATYKGESIYTDTEWGGSKADVNPGEEGLFEIAYDGQAVNLMFMIDTAIYQDSATKHSGHLKISNVKVANFSGEDPEDPVDPVDPVDPEDPTEDEYGIGSFSVTADVGMGKAVYVGGSFNGWTIGEEYKLAWSEGNVWSADIVLPVGEYDFKYVISGYDDITNQDWDTLNPDGAASHIVVEASDEPVDPVDPVDPEDPTEEEGVASFSITHDVGMGKSVYVGGSFNGWTIGEAYQLEWHEGNVWSADIVLPVGEYDFKYVISGTDDITNQDWDTLNEGGAATHIVVTASEEPVDPVDPEDPVEPGEDEEEGNASFSITADVGLGKSVYVGGSFNGWSIGPDYRLEWHEGNVWSAKLNLPVGEYDFKYVISGTDDISVQDWDTLNPGAAASHISVTEEPTTDIETISTTFSITYDGVEEGKAIYVGGSFNGWTIGAAYKLTKSEGGLWTATIKLPAGEYDFKYVISGENDISVQDWDTLNEGGAATHLVVTAA